VPNINDANNKMFFMIVNSKGTSKVLLLGRGCELRNRLFSVKDKILANVNVNLPQNSQSYQNPCWQMVLVFN
jgi:hypothetical protein